LSSFALASSSDGSGGSDAGSSGFFCFCSLAYVEKVEREIKLVDVREDARMCNAATCPVVPEVLAIHRFVLPLTAAGQRAMLRAA